MNKEELVREVSRQTKFPQQLVAVLTCIGSTIKRKTSKGNKIIITGFGSFESRKRAARTGVNPQTGTRMQIQAKSVPVFTPSKKFKDAVSHK
jgi:DNA-binding protein HU-beta